MSLIFELLKELFPGAPTYTEKDYPDLTGKTFLVTGTSAGIGRTTVRLLLGQNASVVMVNRNLAKNERAIEQTIHELIESDPTITEESIRKRIYNVEADLLDLSTFKPAVEKLKTEVTQLDTVILNAGIMHPPNGTKTKQGYEGQFGVNVMAHQLLLDLITPLIKKSAAAGNSPRVVFLTSLGHYSSPANGGLSWDFKDASKSSTQPIYGQSKAGNIYQSAIFAQQNPDIVTVAVHPGLLDTELSRSWPAWTHGYVKYITSPAVYGSYSTLFGALHPQFGHEESGKTYIGPFGKVRKMRPDIEAGCTDGTAKKMVDWIEKEIAPFK